MIKSRPSAGLAVVSLLLVGGLSGCGVAGADFHPGVAAQVGSDSISVSHVDSVATSYCSAIKSQLQGQNQVLPLRYLRGGVVGQLALMSAARQFAAEHHVDAGYQYDQKVSELQSAVAALPEDQQQAVVEVESSSTYVSDIELAVGKQILKKADATTSKSSDATAAGQKAFSDWLDGQDVAINPQFGIEIKNAQAVPTDTSVSYALGDAATQGNADTPDQSYAASLPSSNRCG